MTTAVTPQQKKLDTCRAFLYDNQSIIKDMMPKILNADRFLRVAVSELAKTPKLLECTPASLLGALMQCAQFGLEPSSILGHAYLVPFRNNKKGGIYEVQLIPGYKGLMTLARRSGELSVIDAHEVRAGDQFDYAYGTDPKLTHKPAKSGRGEVEYYYAVARMKDGGVQFVVMSVEDVQEHKARFSRSAENGPWVDNKEEMAKKTCLRKLCKYIPASVELQKAVMLDELSESGIPQGLLPPHHIESSARIEDHSDDEAEQMDDIRNKLKQTHGQPEQDGADHAITQGTTQQARDVAQAPSEEPTIEWYAENFRNMTDPGAINDLFKSAPTHLQTEIHPAYADALKKAQPRGKK